MKLRTPLLALALLPACSSMTSSSNTVAADASENGAAKHGVFPYEIQRAELANGLHVLMVPMPSDGLVAYWSIVRTGSRDEVEKGVTGFAHFFEHMMFHGTKERPGPVYDHIVNGMGANANAFTTDDFTAYHLSVAKNDLPTVIQIEADRFQHLSYEEQDFRTESGAVYGEYRKGRSSPFGVLEEAVRDAAFDAHTYKHTTIGYEADIKAMPDQYAYSKTFFERFYRPENVVILVTGDFDAQQTLAHIQQQYGGWKRGYTAPKITPEPKQTAERRIDVPFDGKTLPLLALNFKGAAFDPSDREVVAAGLIAELAFGVTSPLYKKLVLDEQRVESLDSGFDPNRDPGLWSVYALVKKPADVAAVESELWRTIDDLAKTPVAQERLDAVRSHQRYGFLTRLTTPERVAETCARYVALTGDLACIDRLDATLAKVTSDDVRKAAARWLVREGCTVSVLHSKDQAIPRAASSTVPHAEVAAAASNANVLLVSVDTLRADHLATYGYDTRFAVSDAAEPALVASDETLSQPPVLLPVPNDPTVAFRVWIQCGSQDDPPGKEGLAALTQALVTEGATKQHSYADILNLLFPMAAGYGGSVDREMTIVAGTVHKDHAQKFAQLLVDAIATPAFTDEDFARLRDQAVSAIENDLRYASGEELAKAALMERVFQGTPYAHLDLGTVASLKALTVEDVKEFHKTHWTRDNVVLGLGGAYSSELPRLMSSRLGATLATGKPARVPAPHVAPVQGRQLVIVDNPSAIGSSISIGTPIDVKRGTPEFAALWIANSWLGEHRNSSSHLYQVIREARGLNYGDYSYIEAYPNGGRRNMPPSGVGRRAQLFEIWLRTVPAPRTGFTVRAGLREVENLVKNGLTQEQFDFTKKFLAGYTLHFAESTADRLAYAVDDRFFGTQDHLATFRKQIAAATLAETNAAIAKAMRTENAVIAIVTNDAAGVKHALTSGEPTPIDYGPGITKSAETLAADKEISTWPLHVDPANVTIVPVDAMFQGAAGT